MPAQTKGKQQHRAEVQKMNPLQHRAIPLQMWLLPGGDTNRAQFATIMERLIENVL